MIKSAQHRLQETWTFIQSIAPPNVLGNLRTYHNQLTNAQRERVSNAMAQGVYIHSRPGLMVGSARQEQINARANEKSDRAYRRALILILMAKRNSGNFDVDLQEAINALPRYGDRQESEGRQNAELLNLGESIVMMKAGGQVRQLNWGGWNGAHYRPLRPGCAIGRRGAKGPGTLGCFVLIHNHVYILSNRHVLRQSTLGGVDDNQVIQPAHQLGGTYFDVVAEVSGEDPGHDAAIARVRAGILCDNTTVEGVAITGSAVATTGAPVRKSGCATRERRGTVSNANSQNVNAAGAVLVDQLIIGQNILDPLQDEIFQVKGDSGSVALDYNNRVVALLHGQPNATDAQATHITPILNHFGATILVGQWVGTG